MEDVRRLLGRAERTLTLVVLERVAEAAAWLAGQPGTGGGHDPAGERITFRFSGSPEEQAAPGHRTGAPGLPVSSCEEQKSTFEEILVDVAESGSAQAHPPYCLSHERPPPVRPGAPPLGPNPIFRRYVRSRLRPRRWASASHHPDARGISLFQLPHLRALPGDLPEIADAERAPLMPLLVLQALILFFLGTGQVAGGITGEADEGMLDYQRLTPLTR